jgi:hypothetical protein
MEKYPGQAAWAQAVGSVLAILASGAFAIWVPHHIRTVEDRARCLRAKRAARASLEILTGTFVAVQRAIEDGTVTDGTIKLAEVHARQVRMLIDQIPRHVLGRTAIVHIAEIDSKSIILDMMLRAGNRVVNHGEKWDLHFDVALADLEACDAIFSRMIPRRFDGDWVVELPDSDPNLA